MGLSSLIEKGVAIANKVTGDLQVGLVLQRWIGDDGVGGKKLEKPITVTGILTQGAIPVYSGGEEEVASAYFAVLYPLAPHGAPNRQEPIDPRDQFTMPNGTKPVILKVTGFVDRQTNKPYFSEVWFK